MGNKLSAATRVQKKAHCFQTDGKEGVGKNEWGGCSGGHTARIGD